MMKKILAVLLSMTFFLAFTAGCSSTKTNESKTNESNTNNKKPYIAMISKGFQHQFWQTVYAGAKDAAKKYDVDITFEGPPSESDINTQVDMLKNALSKQPAAIALAALDTESVKSLLEEAKNRGIPVIGFDSGVPDAPSGSIVSTVATNNYAAGQLAAEKMFNNPDFQKQLKAATIDNPVTIAVQSQDATSASVLDRTRGFIDEMVKEVNGVFPGAVEVVGHDLFKKPASKPVVVSIKVVIPPSTSMTDAKSAAYTTLTTTKNLIGYFMSNELSANAVLAATSDGTDLDREHGKYKNIIAIGFDAGKAQKNAVRKQYFYGSITQDPYNIGYMAVEIAYKVIKGEKVPEVIDTGAKFYTHENMDNKDIAPLLYD